MNAADYWRVKRYPSFKHGIGKIYGQPVQFSDNVGFLYSVNEIYLQEVYKFCTDQIDPLIIDAGANIGLSLIYFKRLYPQARIIAYEPDNSIFKLLESNVRMWSCTIPPLGWRIRVSLSFRRDRLPGRRK